MEKLGPQVDVITTDGARPPVTNLWHSDNTTLEQPSLGTFIQIQECPPVGGNTSWANTAKAYRCLSPSMKQYVDGMTAVHYWDGRGYKEPAYLQANWDHEKYSELVKNNPPRHWPIVSIHPITGEKALYVNETYTTYIEGVHRYESDAILQLPLQLDPDARVLHHSQLGAERHRRVGQLPGAALRPGRLHRVPREPASHVPQGRHQPGLKTHTGTDAARPLRT